MQHTRPIMIFITKTGPTGKFIGFNSAKDNISSSQAQDPLTQNLPDLC
jgi:hypothetical protein